MTLQLDRESNPASSRLSKEYHVLGQISGAVWCAELGDLWFGSVGYIATLLVERLFELWKACKV